MAILPGGLSSLLRTNLTTPAKPRVAVLYQDLEPPLHYGVRKTKNQEVMSPSIVVRGTENANSSAGYMESGADIAYVLKNRCGIDVITPSNTSDPRVDEDWVFGDTEAGILAAIGQGATRL